jgi:LAO/AO transport system kinase
MPKPEITKEMPKAELVERIKKGDIRAIARAISLTENNDPFSHDLHAALLPLTGKALVVGITGSPGSGKSTLVDQLAVALKKTGKKPAIVAIDPTSPFSGGAILGDRIRMMHTAEHAEIFIRSIASRGATGGLSRFTFDTVRVLDAAGFDVILVETVGVGQVEVDIVRAVDTCVVVLVPGMGDTVQTFKAGIIEIADVFVINKADRDGADLVLKDLRLLMSVGEVSDAKFKNPIVKTIATTGEGTQELIAAIDLHQKWLRSSDEFQVRKNNIARGTILALLSDLVHEKLFKECPDLLNQEIQKCADRKETPYQAALTLLKAVGV